MKQQAALRAREQSAQEAIAAGSGRHRADAAARGQPVPSVVRVPYVPEFVKDQIQATRCGLNCVRT